MSRLFCFGLGYSASHLARQLRSEGWHVGGTARTPAGAEDIAAKGYAACVFDGNSPSFEVAAAVAEATHILVSVPAETDGDPVLRNHVEDLATARSLAWIGYLSTVGVYGDHKGGWVDETTPPDAASSRAARRIAAEQGWLALGARTAVRVDVFRLAGIYGPGRSAIERVREGSAQRIIKPGQVFNRIHVDDIAASLRASIAGKGTHRIYNVTDDEPAAGQDVIAYAANLLHMPPPPEIDFKDAKLSPAAAAFYSENRRVRNDLLRNDLGVTLKYPTYREGLKAILEGEE
jgi:nucleoside-diphosphate-sugar epimerase